MAAGLDKTTTPGIFRRHAKECKRTGRCRCAYVVVWRHRGKQHTETFSTLSLAREAKGNRDAGERAPLSRESFEDYAATWLATYQGRTARGLRDRTRQSYMRSLKRRAFPFFRGWRLSEVEPPDVRRFIAHLESQGLAPGTIRRDLAPVRAMFATAVEDGTLRHSPTVGVRVGGRPSDAEEERARALTRAELTQLIAELPQEWRLLFELLAQTGLRISEAVGLTWGRVEFGERPCLKVREQFSRGEWRRLKSRAARRDVPLAPSIAQRLWALRRGKADSDLVFASEAGTPLSDGNVRRRVLAPARERAELPWAGFHSLRHTAASLLLAEGRNLRQVASWLGHADAAFTLRTYAHLLDEGLGDAAFFDGLGLARVNTGSTGGPQIGSDGVLALDAETAA